MQIFCVFFLNITRAVFTSAPSCKFIFLQDKNLLRTRNVITFMRIFLHFRNKWNRNRSSLQQIIHFRCSIQFWILHLRIPYRCIKSRGLITTNIVLLQHHCFQFFAPHAYITYTHTSTRSKQISPLNLPRINISFIVKFALAKSHNVLPRGLDCFRTLWLPGAEKAGNFRETRLNNRVRRVI